MSASAPARARRAKPGSRILADRYARALLEGATVGDQKLFLVETYEDNPRKLFFRFRFTDGLTTDACQIGGKRFKFWDQFTLIAIRTGKHIPKADVYSSLAGIPKKQPNHQVFDNIVDFFAA